MCGKKSKKCDTVKKSKKKKLKKNNLRNSCLSVWNLRDKTYMLFRINRIFLSPLPPPQRKKCALQDKTCLCTIISLNWPNI